MARHGIFYSLLGIVLLQLCVLATDKVNPLNVEIVPKEELDDDTDIADGSEINDENEPVWPDYLGKLGPEFLDPTYAGHFIRKRYTDDLDAYGYGPAEMDDDLGYGEYMYDDDDMPLLADKRQASRWKYIYRKLNELDRNSKRSPLRWKLIYRKVNDLDGGAQKRGAGRWRNMNWMLSKGNRLQRPSGHSLQKRFIGRWKNNNWLLQQNQH